MLLKQFYLPCLAHASYVIGDEATGTAAVVDPGDNIERLSSKRIEASSYCLWSI